MAWVAQELPGDMQALASVGMGEGKGIWERMTLIIRARRLDVRQLMAGFDQRRRGFFDLTTFARSLANAFGSQWVELAMTSAEFREICEPYLTRKPENAGVQGSPESLVLWHQFAADLQKMAETRVPADSFLARLAAVEQKERQSAALQRDYGVTEPELRLAFKFFVDRINVYSKRGLTDGFRRIDKDNKGTVTADEIMSFFAEAAHKPYYVNERTIGVLVDWADINGDDAISYNELSQVIRCEDLLELSELVPDKKMVCAEKREGERVVCERGLTAEEVRKAQTVVAERFLERFRGARQALAFIDSDGSGWLSREEFKGYLKSMNVLTYKDKKSNRVMKGPLSVKEVDGMLDVVDIISANAGGARTPPHLRRSGAPPLSPVPHAPPSPRDRPGRRRADRLERDGEDHGEGRERTPLRHPRHRRHLSVCV